MFKKIKTVAIAILAILGVMFIILMLIPDDETADENEAEVAVEESVTSTEESVEVTSQVAEETVASSEEEVAETTETTEEVTEASSDTNAGSGNTVNVNVPASEISDKTLKFKSLTLDNKEVTQDIFKDYDLTVVHMWGTYCMPCVKGIGDYAQFYKDLPDNINMVAIIVDVYDGIDNNVSSANKILGDAGAEFVNIRTSDSLYDLMKSIQYVPSSLIVDKDGHIVGQIMDGASFEQTKSKLNEYIK